MVTSLLSTLNGSFLNSKKNLFSILFLMGLIGGNLINAQVATNYTFQELQITPAYAELAYATKTQLIPVPNGIWDDSTPVNTPIGFTFTFNGVNYTAINVSPNGFITFGPTAPTPGNYFPISSLEGYDGAIAAYGANLKVTTTALSGAYQINSVSKFLDTSGGAGNYILKVEWNYFKRGTDATSQMKTQIWLNQNGNIIDVRFDTATAPSTTAITGQVGLRGSSNADYNNRSWTTTAVWPALPATMAAGGSNAASVLTRNTSYPNAASNRLFRWTPVTCSVPTALAVGSLGYNTATATWTAPSPTPAQYNYEIRTSGAAGSGATGLAQSGNSTVSPLNMTGLSGGVTYTIYIRSDCGGTYSAWSSGVVFTTLCNPVNTNYFMYFDPFDSVYPYSGPPVLPPCHSIQNVGVGPLNVWKTSNPTTASNTGGFYDEHLVYDATTGTGGTDNANVWFFTAGINLVGGTTYKLDYMYGGSTETSTITNKMLVKYGTAPTDAAMTAGTTLADHNNIKASPITNYISFTPATTGVYYFGFKAYSDFNNGRLFLDNIEVTQPGCMKPTGLSVSSVTGTSATVTWTAPSPAPSSGYAYYLTTTNTAPAYTQVPTGFVPAGSTVLNLSGLTGSTTYYIWVRGYCYTDDYSEWSSSQTFTTLFQPAYCIPSSTSSASYFSNFTTTGGIANINNSSGYTTGGYASYISQFVSQSAGNSVNFSFGLAGPTVGVAIWVDWNNDGTFSTAERMYNTGAYVSTASGSFTVPGGQAVGDYTMRILMDYWATSPSPCTFSATGPRGEAEDYTFRVVTPPPALALNISTSTQCASTNSPLVQITPATLGNYDTYSWSPSIGVTGSAAAGYTFNSNTTITYTLTGTQTVSPYATRSVTFTYNANPLPTPITITPTATTVCQSGPATLVSATGGIVSGVPILTEDFNSGAPTWTTTNTSTGGTTTAPAWTIRSSGYNPGGTSGITSIVSNDSSQFYLSNSDAQGSGSNTFVTLLSPTFSLAGYTNASLSFYHYYKPWINGSATVEIYNGSSWITLQTWGNSSTTSAQGTPTAFANAIYNLNSYIGMSGLQIRFTYQASWGFVWAIDNFLVSGSASSAITWNTQTSPVANGVAVPGLYTDVAATTQYLAGTGTNSIYVLPSATTTFVASASTPSPVCSSTSTIAVTVTPIVGGTASSAQSICSGSPANLTLTGSSGTITKWQYSTVLAFTSPVDIPSSNSATLTSAQMGVLTADRYYRAVVTNGVCTAYSNIIKITFNSSTWNGSSWSNGTPTSSVGAVFSGNYSSDPAINSISPGNLTACSVTVTSGNVDFISGHTLTVQNNVTVSGGTLAFENNASLVQVSNTATNSGNITYYRNTTPLTKFDYTYWSSPVAPQTLVSLSPLTLSDKYFSFDPATNSWINVSSNSLMNPGKGYIIRAPNNFSTSVPAVFNASFYGIPNNGVISTPIVLGSSDVNLIGNPYPSALNINTFFDFNGITTGTGVVDKTIYLWTHTTPINNNNYSNSDYAIYNYMGGVGTSPGNGSVTPNGYVASGQAFFIKGLANGNAVFNNSMRVTGNNNQFFKNVNQSATNSQMSRVWLEMFDNQGLYKQTMVGYAAGATNDFDSGYDGEIVEAGNPISIYSILNPKKLGIQGRGLPFNENDIVPLGYKATTSGTYEIKLSNFDGIFDTQKVYLEDKLLNVIHDLKLNNYSFATNAGTFENRFNLRFTSSGLSTANQSLSADTIVIYKENQNIHINTGVTTMSEVNVYDVRGALLFTKNNINASDLMISNLNSSQQILLISVKSVDGKEVTKKFIF